jgi:GDPmannose 4,6-dehydratase
MERILITGIGGQDGPYLAELLLAKGSEVWGMRLQSETAPNARLERFAENPKFHVLVGDLRDESSVAEVVRTSLPDKVFNLAAQSGVGISFSIPEETLDINYHGLRRLMDAATNANPNVRIYQASTSEMFGKTPPPQSEESPFAPVSPYGASKLQAHLELVIPRRAQGAFICSGILFNHESPFRGENFVTRKITIGLAQIALGRTEPLLLGNLEARRDWGFAGDYVRAMDMMLEQERPDDYVIATGVSHSIRDFAGAAAQTLGIPLAWEGSGMDEVGVSRGTPIIKINPEFYRPMEVDETRGDARKAERVLGWKPKVSFAELVRMMAEYDFERLKRTAR